jgi:hypothetical protein
MAMRVGESPGPGARRWLYRFSHEKAGKVQACNRRIKAERESFTIFLQRRLHFSKAAR